jgi:hypothetical protein
LRHLVWALGKNSRKTSEKSIGNGGEWRFLRRQSAISAFVYARETEAQSTDMPRLTSANRAASSDLPTANSKTERHLEICRRSSPHFETTGCDDARECVVRTRRRPQFASADGDHARKCVVQTGRSQQTSGVSPTQLVEPSPIRPLNTSI